MPVPAKLSRRLYETFGDEIANELVEWFNQVDATYRADLRELNELNFARFDAKLEQRVTELRADFDRRFVQLDAKIGQRVAELRAEFGGRFVELDAKITHHVGQLRQEMAGFRAELIKWMFVFWAGTLIPLAALMVAMMVALMG